jgi:hypothetical protein
VNTVAVGFVLPATHRQLDGTQRAVIVRSRRHRRTSLAASGTRWRRARPLDDPRLEALRRYVVLLRTGGDDWASEAASALVAQGYTIDQIAHARWLVACEAPDTPRRVSAVVLVLLAKAVLLTALLIVHASPVWPLALVLGLLAIVARGTEARSRRAAWERNFIVV